MSAVKQLLAVALCLVLLVVSGTGQAASIGDVEKQLLADIKESRGRLQRLERSQLQERKKLSQRLQSTELSVAKLRDKAAVMQRLADEKTLALDSIEERLRSWREQEAYQLYALNDLLGGNLAANGEPAFVDMLASLKTRIGDLQGALEPAWQQRDVVGVDGQLHSTRVLKLGPVSWAYDSQSNSGGLLAEGEIPSLALQLNSSATGRWQEVIANNAGTLQFDPSLGRAIEMAKQKETLVQHLDKGGLWAIPILAFGLVALICALLKSWQLFRQPKWLDALGSRVKAAARNGDTDTLRKLAHRANGCQGKLIEICLKEQDSGKRDDALFNHLMFNKQHLEKWLGTIAVIASVAPLLGLLGTVSGMIQTFKLMTIFGSGDASAVSGGISEALITTELGLVVAIPALLLHAILQRWVRQHLEKAESLALDLSGVDMPEPQLQEKAA